MCSVALTAASPADSLGQGITSDAILGISWTHGPVPEKSLKGAKPLTPLEQPTTLQMVINLKMPRRSADDPSSCCCGRTK